MAVFSIISATFTGNRGAEALLRSMIENITLLNPQSSFFVLSVYPHDDVNENEYSNVEVVDCRPKVFMIKVFIEALITHFFWKLPKSRLSTAARSIMASDLILDLSGVSFVDGRGLPLLIYNSQCVLIPKWFGKPVMKVAQAMGPFHSTINQLAASYCLKQVAILVSRGYITSKNLTNLGTTNFIELTDAAFSLPERKIDGYSIANEMGDLKKNNKRIVGICPSVVVEEYCAKENIDYYIVMNKLIDYILEKDYCIVLFAHSARDNSNKKKNNDLPLCRRLVQKRSNKQDILFIDDTLNANELRSLISRCDFFVGSRFHSIISALCVNVPFFLIGWSHKYTEVLQKFGLSEQAMDFKDISVSKLCDRFDYMVEHEQDIRKSIRNNIQENIELSKRNAALAVDFVRGNYES